MLNFAVGPVQSSEEVRKIGNENVPYFRTAEFSEIMKENERIFLDLMDAPANSRAIFLTGSGTASMEAAVMNTLDASDKALVINGGSFGARFAKICSVHDIAHDCIELEAGHTLCKEDLAPYENAGYTALLVNMGETSTGVLYDMNLIGDFCTRNNLFLIVDTVSTFLADPFSMKNCGADIALTGSQKALACPPGVSVLALSPRAQERVARIDPKCIYFDFKDALSNGQRGQTPFTPAVQVLLQINARLKDIETRGIDDELGRVAARAKRFRKGIEDLPMTIFAQNPQTAVTSLKVKDGVDTKAIFDTCKDEFDMWLCPNGGELGKKIFRVGHIGELTLEDVDEVIRVLHVLNDRGMLGA